MTWDFDERTEEESNLDYLKQNPALESGLWADWVETVCGWRKIALPSHNEWAILRMNFYHGKTPENSVNELEALRK